MNQKMFNIHEKETRVFKFCRAEFRCQFRLYSKMVADLDLTQEYKFCDIIHFKCLIIKLSKFDLKCGIMQIYFYLLRRNNLYG